MLRRIPYPKFVEWMAYHELEPFGEVRADYRAAQICTMLANINRDPKKRPRPYEIKDFVLSFEPKKKQTPEDMIKVLTMWATSFATEDKQIILTDA